MPSVKEINYNGLTPRQKAFVADKIKDPSDLWWIDYGNMLVGLITGKRDPRFVRYNDYEVVNCKSCRAKNHVEMSICWTCGLKLKFRRISIYD